MEWIAAMFADAANNSAEGKLNMLGIFSELLTQSAPCHMTAAFIVMLRAEPFDRGATHEVSIEVVDEDGSVVHQIPPLQLTVPDQTGYAAGPTQMILNLQGFPFQKFGDYRFEVYVNGQHKGGTGIKVRSVPPGQGPTTR